MLVLFLHICFFSDLLSYNSWGICIQQFFIKSLFYSVSKLKVTLKNYCRKVIVLFFLLILQPCFLDMLCNTHPDNIAKWVFLAACVYFRIAIFKLKEISFRSDSQFDLVALNCLVYLIFFLLEVISPFLLLLFACMWLLIVLHSLLVCGICRFVVYHYQWRLYWSAAKVKHVTYVNLLISASSLYSFFFSFSLSFLVLRIKSTRA